jgi:hypothetical protein
MTRHYFVLYGYAIFFVLPLYHVVNFGVDLFTSFHNNLLGLINGFDSEINCITLY